MPLCMFSCVWMGCAGRYHYTHWHCSPTRRSFLTGRLPVHHGEQLSPNADDDIDLRMTWISEKLAGVGYTAHWFGKMHTGFRSFRHLGFQHNFTETSIGSLQTGGAYSGPQHTTRWQVCCRPASAFRCWHHACIEQHFVAVCLSFLA